MSSILVPCLLVALQGVNAPAEETVYEIWYQAKGQQAKKYSEAATREEADRVAASLRSAKLTAEVRGPITRKAKEKADGTPQPTTPAPAEDPTLSGAKWWHANQAKYPNSRKVEDLADGFRENVQAFLDALKAAGANVTISSTRRSKERAYLMHWSWKLLRGEVVAKDIPAQAGVTIKWDHGDETKSRKAAQEMVDLFQIAYQPSLTSRHIEGKAIDMTI